MIDYLLGAVKINSLFRYCDDKDNIKKKGRQTLIKSRTVNVVVYIRRSNSREVWFQS